MTVALGFIQVWLEWEHQETHVHQTGQSTCKRCEVEKEPPAARFNNAQSETAEWSREKAGEQTLLPGLTKLFGLTGSVLVPTTSEPGFNLSLGFATTGHQSDYFTLEVILHVRTGL